MARAALPGRLTWQLASVARARRGDRADEEPRARAARLAGGYRAGQHVDVRLTAEDGYQAQRSYSIASAPEDDHLVLTVERLDDGEVSPYLVDVLRPGDRARAAGPDRRLLRVGGVARRAAGADRRRLGHRAAALDAPPLGRARTARCRCGSCTRRGRMSEVIYRDELLGYAARDDVDLRFALTREWPEDWSGPPGPDRPGADRRARGAAGGAAAHLRMRPERVRRGRRRLAGRRRARPEPDQDRAVRADRVTFSLSPTRAAAVASHAMVASSQPLATLAGLDVLREGGNAVDAAICAAAVLCVTEPHATGIGGDLFAIVRDPSGAVHGIDAAGPAPRLAPREPPRRGRPALGRRPGRGRRLGRARRAVRPARAGRCLAPAIDLAAHGRRPPDSTAPTCGGRARARRRRSGRRPRSARVYRLPELAETLFAIATHGPEYLYTGPPARRSRTPPGSTARTWRSTARAGLQPLVGRLSWRRGRRAAGPDPGRGRARGAGDPRRRGPGPAPSGPRCGPGARGRARDGARRR